VRRCSNGAHNCQTATMVRASHLSAALLPVLLLLLGCAQAAPTVRTDNSPICNTVFPQCQAKCKQGQDYMFVCSAGNGPQGGPYILCQCVAPAMPVGPRAQGELGYIAAVLVRPNIISGVLTQQDCRQLSWLQTS
jgi:hypothetical protein